MEKRSPSREQRIRLLAETTEAIVYLHEHGLWHRDLKPANILVDTNDRPHVTDFGLALHESAQREQGDEIVGTFPYTSPEQVRGETNRLDGRTDIWSLGVILYELLVGRRPFQGNSTIEIFDEIEHKHPRTPREIDPSVPGELQRICLTCLAKLQTDRYCSAADLLDDLRSWLAGQSEPQTDKPEEAGPDAASRIKRKGLRSFDEHDTDFFLDLLPGARDRDGLPDSLRFWKTRIEERRAAKTFSVGLILGPSGCGKSSFVRAGLLPRLAEHIKVVYVEATPDDTEVRLLKGIREQFTTIPAISLPKTLRRLREESASTGRKVLLVLDQFEQWLHKNSGDQAKQLVAALRLCDGEHVQCLVLVRDDFFLAVSRFFNRELEVPMVEDHNFACSDLFDTEHAHKVLSTFGQAFGKLAEENSDSFQEQDKFLNQAVAGLADENGKVSPVRLALFAQMMKERPWTTAALYGVGEARGEGFTFLDLGFTFLVETFTKSPEYRCRKDAALAVLKALLPQSADQIKGPMLSYSKLLLVSGPWNSPKGFDDLIHVLDGKLRLISPTDPEGMKSGNGEQEASASRCEHHGERGESASCSELQSADAGRPPERFYQLTHDYLVPSVKKWVDYTEGLTRPGRTKKLLDELTQQWSPERKARYLPSPLEFFGICFRSQWWNWNVNEWKMMRAAGWYYLKCLASIVVALVLVISLVSAIVYRPPPAPPSAWDTFRNPQEEINSRLAAFEELAPKVPNDPDMFRAVIRTLSDESENSPALLVGAVEKLDSAMRRAGDSAKQARRDDWVKFLRDLMENRQGVNEVRSTAFEAILPAQTRVDNLKLIRHHVAKELDPALVAKMLAAVDGMKLANDESDRAQLARKMFDVIEKRDSKLASKCVERVDELRPEQLIGLVLLAGSGLDGKEVAKKYLLPYVNQTRRERGDPIARNIEKQLNEISEEWREPEISTSFKVEFLVAAIGLLQSLSPNSFDDGFKVVNQLLQQRKKLRDPDILDTIIEAFVPLVLKQPEIRRDLKPLREILKESIRESDNSRFGLVASIRALGKLADVDSLRVLSSFVEDTNQFGPMIQEATIKALADFGKVMELQNDSDRLKQIETTLDSLIEKLSKEREKDPLKAELLGNALIASAEVSQRPKTELMQFFLDPATEFAAHKAMSLMLQKGPQVTLLFVRAFLEWRVAQSESVAFLHDPIHSLNGSSRLGVDMSQDKRDETYKTVAKALAQVHEDGSEKARELAGQLLGELRRGSKLAQTNSSRE